MIFFKICSSHFCWTTSLWRRATARSISALETLWQGKFKLSFDKTKIYDLVTRCLFICFKTRASCRVLTTQLSLFPSILNTEKLLGTRLKISYRQTSQILLLCHDFTLSQSPTRCTVSTRSYLLLFLVSFILRNNSWAGWNWILLHFNNTFEIIAGSDPVKENL